MNHIYKNFLESLRTFGARHLRHRHKYFHCAKILSYIFFIFFLAPMYSPKLATGVDRSINLIQLRFKVTGMAHSKSVTSQRDNGCQNMQYPPSFHWYWSNEQNYHMRQHL